MTHRKLDDRAFASDTGRMDLSLKSLQEAVRIREQIDALEKRLASLFQASSDTAAPVATRKRTMSPAARKKSAAAQRARWATKQGGGTQTSTAGKKSRTAKKGGITAAGRKRLSEMMKARWAARKRSR